jgi:cardiolipin synthase
VGKPMPVKPLLVSKLNTVAQIVFACLVLAALGLGFNPGPLQPILMASVAILTLASVAYYVIEWVRHINRAETQR